jgi:DBF zinc finger
LESHDIITQGTPNPPGDEKAPGNENVFPPADREEEPLVKLSFQASSIARHGVEFNQQSPFPLEREEKPLKGKGRMQTNVLKRPRQRNFCQCCNEYFDQLAEHLKSNQHKNFASSPTNYAAVDDLISDLSLDSLCKQATTGTTTATSGLESISWSFGKKLVDYSSSSVSVYSLLSLHCKKISAYLCILASTVTGSSRKFWGLYVCVCADSVHGQVTGLAILRPH